MDSRFPQIFKPQRRRDAEKKKLGDRGDRGDRGWDWAGAERHYKRALELDRSSVHGYALYLSAAGRHEEAIAQIKRAEELDPLNLPLKFNFGLNYLYARIRL